MTQELNNRSMRSRWLADQVERERNGADPLFETVSSEFAFPISVGLDLIDHYATPFVSVALQIALCIAVQVETAS